MQSKRSKQHNLIRPSFKAHAHSPMQHNRKSRISLHPEQNTNKGFQLCHQGGKTKEVWEQAEGFVRVARTEPVHKLHEGC